MMLRKKSFGKSRVDCSRVMIPRGLRTTERMYRNISCDMLKGEDFLVFSEGEVLSFVF